MDFSLSRPARDVATRTRRRRALAAVAFPLLITGVLLAFLLLAAHGPGGRWWTVAGMLAAFGLLGFGFLGRHVRFVPAALLLWALGMTVASFDDWVLASRGLDITCTVLEKGSRVETSTSTDSNGHTTTTSTTHYDYRLDCPGGRPTAMTSTTDAGSKGQPLQVVYDPAGRIDPEPARGTDTTAAWVAGGLLTAAMVVGAARELFGRNTRWR
ncbi:hypothetical protein ACF059_14085 [Streptomyces sp. NPDC016562]|uniref:hypothetical protein n=1 Tax=Streptomyces sp. NPDC016562 TaxID=3364966 RepID=UPI0036F93E66